MPPGDSDSPAEHDHLVDTPHMVAAPLSKSRPGPSPIVLAADSSDAAAAAAAAAATVAAGQSLPMPPPPPPPPTPPPMPGVAEAAEPGATPASVPHSSSTHSPPPSTAHSAHISPRRPLPPTSPEAAGGPATAHPAATTPAATSVAHPSAVSTGGRSAAEVGGGACPTTASPALASADVSGTDLPRGSGGVRHEAEAAAPPALSEGGTAGVPRQGSNRLSRRSTPQQLPHQGEEATTTTSAVQQPRSLATSTPAAAAAGGAAVEAGTSYLPRGSLGEVREARSDPHTASSLPQPHDGLSRPDSKRSHRSTAHAPAAAAPPPPQPQPQPTSSESCGGGGGGFKPVDDAASSCAGGGGGSRLPSLAEALASFELHELAGVGGGGSAATPTTAPPSAPHSRITPSLRGDGAFATTAAAAAVSPPQRTPHNAAPQSSSSSSSSLREEITRLSQAVPPAAPCGATRSPAAASHDLPSVSSIPAAATSSSSPAAAAATAATPAAPAAPGVPPPRTGARQPPLGGGGGGGSGSRGFTGVQHGLRRATPVWDADPDKTRAYVRTPVFEGADKPTMPRMYAPLHKATVETAAATAKATAAAACSPPYSPLSPNRQAMRIRTPQDTKSGAPTDAAVAAAAAGGSAFRHDVRAVTPPPLDDQASFPYDLELAALADEQRTRLHTLYQQKVLTREQYKAARRKVNEASRHNTTVASLSPERNREHRRVLE